MAQQNPHKESAGHSAPAVPDTHAGTQPAPEHKGGLPQLNVDDFAPQLVWLALTFGALYWIMSRIALPRIGNAIEKRRDRIASDLDAANGYGQESEQAEIAYKAALADAKAKAHAIAQEQKDKLTAKTDAKSAEVEKVIAAKLAEAEQRITASKKAAMTEVNAIASSTTKEIVARLVGEDVSDDDLSKAIKTIAAN